MTENDEQPAESLQDILAPVLERCSALAEELAWLLLPAILPR